MTVDLPNSLPQLLVNFLKKNLVNKLIRGQLGGHLDQNLGHCLPNGFYLTLDQVGIELDLSLGPARNDLDENPQGISILGLQIDGNVYQGPSLPDGLLDLISGQLKFVKRGQTVVSLDVLDKKFYFF